MVKQVGNIRPPETAWAAQTIEYKQEVALRIKMIVTDLDRTLLRTDLSISDYTAGVLNRCRKSGIKIVFATARYLRHVKDFAMQIPVDAVIAINGAIIYVGGEIVIEHTIPENTKHSLVRELNTAGIKIAAEAPNVVYTNRHTPDDDRIIWDFANEVPIPIHRISIRHHDTEQVMRIAQKYDDLRVYSNSGETLLDIGPAEADKSKGVYEVSELLGIPMSEIAAFGDDFNDIEMLKECGIGVAVANACEEAKAAADYVCGTNDEDGMARWLEEHVMSIGS